MVNNGSDLDYNNVSASCSLTADNFAKIAAYIANPSTTCDLINFNCTSFVYQACKTGNLTARSTRHPWACRPSGGSGSHGSGGDRKKKSKT